MKPRGQCKRVYGQITEWFTPPHVYFSACSAGQLSGVHEAPSETDFFCRSRKTFCRLSFLSVARPSENRTKPGRGTNRQQHDREVSKQAEPIRNPPPDRPPPSAAIFDCRPHRGLVTKAIETPSSPNEGLSERAALFGDVSRMAAA